MRQVLLIEDCPENQQSLQDALCDHGFSVTTISSAEQAMASVEQWASQYEVVIIEEAIHGCGLDLLHEAHTRRGKLPVVIVTRAGEWNGYERALSEGAIDYLACPVDTGALLNAVESALTPAT